MNGDGFREYVEHVRAASDIVQVVKEHVELGPSNQAKCPFHEDHSPSFSVNPKGQYFHCFGCCAGGDVFRFVERVEGIAFIDALERLAARAGLPAWAYTPETRLDLERDRGRRAILAAAAHYYHGRLTAEARTYLTQQRGIPDDLIEQFQIGWADGELRRHLLGAGFEEAACIDAGVLKERDGRVLDFLYHRIVFPLLWHGQAVQLTGRRLDGAEPKYLHLGIPLARFYNEEALAADVVCVVEGPLDVISLVAWGYPAVGLMGTGSHLDRLKEKCARVQRVNVCLDGDAAGERRAADVAQAIGRNARIVCLPGGTDPNDLLLRDGRDEFARCVDAAVDVIQYRIQEIPAETAKTELPDCLAPVLQELAAADPAKAEAHLGEIKHRFGLKTYDMQAYRKSLRKHRQVAEATEATTAEKVEGQPAALFEGLVDLVEQDGQPAFLIREGNKLVVSTSVTLDDGVLVPPPAGQVKWRLPRAEMVLHWYPRDTDEALYDDLRRYHHDISDLPLETHYDLIAAWVIHTYLLESFQYSPYLWLFGVPERGKSRTGKGIIYVAYRGLHVESLRDAYLIRVAEYFCATLFFDVMDLWQKAERQGTEDLLLQRFEKGATVPRVLYPEKGAHRDMVYFSIFGPTIIGTNEPVHKILETRAVLVNLPQARRQFEDDVTPERGLPLRERLVAFRARHMGEELPVVAKPAPGRLGDILRPLLQVIRLVRPEREFDLLALFRELQRARRADKSESIEAQILAVVASLEAEVVDGLLPVKRITGLLNEGRVENTKVSASRVAKRLIALGFDRDRLPGNTAALVWNQDRLARAMDEYGLTETPNTPHSPESLFCNNLDRGVSLTDLPGVPTLPEDAPPTLPLVSGCPAKTRGEWGELGVPLRVVDGGKHTHACNPDLGPEDFEERAGIAEFDGGLTRGEAEALANARHPHQLVAEHDDDTD